MTDNAEHEKRSAATWSVVAALGLTGMKLAVGLSTGSLGVLAEAAHSGLDLLAAGLTLFAVRLAGKPADDEHPYGHGKAENLSALFETLLLLATCCWILYEAAERLMGKGAPVDTAWYAYLVMGVSIAIDWGRSRNLMAMAKKHHSQALEADALHFSTDIWSSAVVIVGLLATDLARWVPALSWLGRADAVSAAAVACIAAFVSFRMGKQALHSLMDKAPDGLPGRIHEAVQGVRGVVDIHDLRCRHSGAHLFVDAHITMDGGMSLRQAHALADKVEDAIRALAPGADITVHPEPDECAKLRKARGPVKRTRGKA